MWESQKAKPALQNQEELAQLYCNLLLNLIIYHGKCRAQKGLTIIGSPYMLVFTA